MLFFGSSGTQRTFNEEQLQTNTFGHIAWRVGVALVALAAEGAVCVLAEAVVATDGFIETLIDICKARAHRERGGGHNINIYSIALHNRLSNWCGKHSAGFSK